MRVSADRHGAQPPDDHSLTDISTLSSRTSFELLSLTERIGGTGLERKGYMSYRVVFFRSTAQSTARVMRRL